MAPCLALAGYMWFGDPDLRPILGLAWDCGAVTTGPVTVPVHVCVSVSVCVCVSVSLCVCVTNGARHWCDEAA